MVSFLILIIDSSTPLFSRSTVTASSQLSPQYSPKDAALSSSSAWCPQENFTDSEYLEVRKGYDSFREHCPLKTFL